MKKIAKVTLKSATPLKPVEMNRIHFGGIHSPLTPGALLAPVCADDQKTASAGSKSGR